ncbi:MAG: riboflavin biosynthesis protein RibF [Anaerosomatales bacterium]|nr:riboflavin biosynthesis protein RibF [Anaerosomatales bacterium]MDT8433375.1 riboflavin biosynthesis protein RibF [Anaerosomatales bacterium]
MTKVFTWEKGAGFFENPVVAAIGVFDGVHIGHQTLLRDCARDARARGRAAVAVTFDRDPDQVVNPEAAGPQLLALEDKCTFLLNAGANHVLVVPFDASVASLSPEAFLSDILLEALTLSSVHVGKDFRFGRYAEGTVSTLESAGAVHGFDVQAHELVTAGESTVTSTRIRALVAAGDVTAAAALLGRDHRVTGLVVRGRGIGRRELGIPTANLLPREHAALPREGVYAGWALVGDARHLAALSVGTPPTFPDAHDQLEAHILDLDADVYGATITVGFRRHLRDQREFGSRRELADAIRHDIDAVRRATRHAG